MCKYWWYEWKGIRPNVTWTVYGLKESLFHSNLKSSNSEIHHYVFHDDPHRHDDEELKYQKTEIIDYFQIINRNHIKNDYQHNTEISYLKPALPTKLRTPIRHIIAALILEPILYSFLFQEFQIHIHTAMFPLQGPSIPNKCIKIKNDYMK